MESRVLCWVSLSVYGHVLQTEDNVWVKKCMEYGVEGSRPRGRPKRTWREVVKDCQACKLNKEDAMDLSSWRKLIKDVWWSASVCECFFWYRPTLLVLDKGPLNGFVCDCVYVSLCVCVWPWAYLWNYILIFLSSCTWLWLGRQAALWYVLYIYFFSMMSHCLVMGDMEACYELGALLQATSRIPKWWIGERPPDMVASCDIYK